MTISSWLLIAVALGVAILVWRIIVLMREVRRLRREVIAFEKSEGEKEERWDDGGDSEGMG